MTLFFPLVSTVSRFCGVHTIPRSFYLISTYAQSSSVDHNLFLCDVEQAGQEVEDSRSFAEWWMSIHYAYAHTNVYLSTTMSPTDLSRVSISPYKQAQSYEDDRDLSTTSTTPSSNPFNVSLPPFPFSPSLLPMMTLSILRFSLTYASSSRCDGLVCVEGYAVADASLEGDSGGRMGPKRSKG